MATMVDTPDAPAAAANTAERPSLASNRRESLRMSLIRMTSQKNSVGKLDASAATTVSSSFRSSTRSSIARSSMRRSSAFMRMHESIQSAIALDVDLEDSSIGAEDEPDDGSSIESLDPIADEGSDEDKSSIETPTTLPEEAEEPSSSSNLNGSMKDSSSSSFFSADQDLERLISRKSSGLKSLGSLASGANKTMINNGSKSNLISDTMSTYSSGSSRRTKKSTSTAGNRGLKATAASQDSIVNQTIAPESSKLRGNNINSILVTPLPVQLARLGLFGRDEEVKTLQAALLKYPWTNKNYKKNSTSTSEEPLARSGSKRTKKVLEARQVAGSGSEDASPETGPGETGSKKERKSKRRSTMKLPAVNYNRQLAWIKGGSGSGKTALADHALREEVSKHGGLYVTGKFENKLQANNDNPFVGLADACDNLCVQLLASHFSRQEEYDYLLECLRNQMTKKEATIILRLIPGLGPILECVMGEDTHDITSAATTIAQKRDLAKERIQVLLSHELDMGGNKSDAETNQQHFQFVFHKFLSIVAAVFPLVMVFDDLQWADMGSLELLEIIIYDRLKFSSNIMIIGCYRDDEVNPEHPLVHMQKQIASKVSSKSCPLNIIDLHLADLTASDLNQCLSELLKQDPSKTDSLAQICHRKVGGNAFFFARFITMLSQDNLIQYNLVSSKWEWDEQEINESSATTQNVINFLQSRLSSLPENAKQLLLFASCLGTEFDLPTMTLVMEDFFHPGVPFQEDLELCLQEGVLENCNTNTHSGQYYRWVHDKLMEASQTLLPNEELPKLKFCVGAALLKHMEPQALEDEIFVIANLINEAPDLSDTPVSIAELNLRAAKKAASLSSFHAAAEYCAQGIDLLPEANKWISDFDLTLQLHSTAARMYSTLGDYEAMEKECNEVIGRSDVDIVNKIQPYDFLMDSICYRGRLPEAIAMCLDVLEQLGVTYPKNKFIIGMKIGKGLKQARKTVDGRCEALLKAPLLEDATHQGAMRFMGKMCKFGYLAKSPLLPLSAIKMGKYSLKYGLANGSAKNCALIGMITSAFGGDIQTGSKYGQLALDVIDRLPEGQMMLPETHYIAYGLVLHQTRPVHTIMKPLLHVYNVSLEWGITEYACWSISIYLILALRSGKALPAIEIDLRAYTKQMDEMQIDKPNMISRMLWQLIMNLMDFPDTSPLVLTGDAMDEMQFMAEHSSNPYYFNMFQAYQSCLYALLGKHELGADLATSKADMLAAHPGSPTIVIDAFYQGVSCFAAARETKNKKYIAHAKKMQAKIDGWAKSGNPNVLHFSSFLSAEKAALKGRKAEAEKLYKTAVVSASKQGFIHDAALANERLAELYEYEFNDKSSAGFRVQEAVRLHSDWGAHRKVRLLQESKADLLKWCTSSDRPDEISFDMRQQAGSSRLSIGSGWGSKR